MWPSLCVQVLRPSASRSSTLASRGACVQVLRPSLTTKRRARRAQGASRGARLEFAKSCVELKSFVQVLRPSASRGARLASHKSCVQILRPSLTFKRRVRGAQRAVRGAKFAFYESCVQVFSLLHLTLTPKRRARRAQRAS